jgi:hypothetical protein
MDGAETLAELRNFISDVSYERLTSFRTQTDLQIVSAMRLIVRTPDAQGAAAEAARDCHALAGDLHDIGATPSPACEAYIADARARALASLDRLIEAIAACGPRIDYDDKGRRGSYARSSSVVMKKRPSYQRREPAPEPVQDVA